MKELNNSIKEDYCSFEVSKLLKEKGFDIKCKTFFNEGSGWKIQNDDILRCGSDDDIVERPTVQMAIQWIRINFGIWIYILPYSTLFRPYAEEIIDKDRFGKWEGHKYNSPQEANEQAILFTLNNL